MLQSLTFLWSAAFIAAIKIGHFDSELCLDGVGLEECYAGVDAAWEKCVNDPCDPGEDRFCAEFCSCRRSEEQVNCAVSHCWNLGYSCEYQKTVRDMTKWCMGGFDNVPFFPPPENAPGACSCNYGKILTSFYRSHDNVANCSWNMLQLHGEAKTDEEFRLYNTACLCCAKSAQLSAFYNFCPDIDPMSLGIDEVLDKRIETLGDWSECGNAMSQVPCGKGGFDFTPPGEKPPVRFYSPGAFPANGTRSATNMPGTMTSPPNGEIMTWDFLYKYTATLAIPQATGAGTNNRSEEINQDQSNGKTTDHNNDTSNVTKSNNQNSGDEKTNHGAASALFPKVHFILGVFAISLII